MSKLVVYSARYPDIAFQLLLNPPHTLQGLEEIQITSDAPICYVYGLATCHETVFSWLEENHQRKMIFLEDDLRAFAKLKTQKIIDHPQIYLKYVQDDWDTVLEQCAAEFPSEKISLLAIKSYQKKPLFRKIHLDLFRKTLLWHSFISENISAHLLHQNICTNLRRLPECFYVNKWVGSLKDLPLIICGAGPSLKTDLAAVRDKGLILACGSALSALAHLGIRPHLGIALDPNAREFECLKGCTYSDLPLLFGSRLYPKVFDLFHGPYGYIRSGTGGRLESHVEETLGLNDPFLGPDLGREALSVTTLALALGQAWGCNPIVFAGVDLAYEKGKHYASGVPVEQTQERQLLRRKGVQGPVSTLVKWVMERDTIDHYAKNHPQTTFFNVSQGLRFKNIQQATLHDIFKNREAIDFDEKITQMIRETKTDISAYQVEKILDELEKSFANCQNLFSLLQKHTGGKAVLYETELSVELAYNLVLEQTEKVLEQIGKSDEKWKLLEEASESYRTTLKGSSSVISISSSL